MWGDTSLWFWFSFPGWLVMWSIFSCICWQVLPCVCVCVLVVQLCPTLCDPMNCNPPDSSVHGIFQAKILEWGAIPFSRGLSWHRDPTQDSCIAGWFLIVWVILSKPPNVYSGPWSIFVFDWIICFLSCMNFFCIFYTYSFYLMYHCQISSPIQCVALVLLMVSFAVQIYLV